MDNQKKKKIGLMHSIVLKVMLCVGLGVLLTWLVEVFTYIPLMTTEMADNAEFYMYDMVVSYGKLLDRDIALEGDEEALSPAALRDLYSEVTIKCAESGYVYIVDDKGTMLYHPTTDKIGQPVENVVIKGVVSQLEMGSFPEPEIVTYDFKGVTKYAAYYVGQDKSYILVVTADQHEILEPVTNARNSGIWSGIVALTVSLFVAFFVVRLVIRPLKRLTNEIDRLAGLDFTVSEIQKKLVKRKDETGQISRAVANLRDALIKVVEQVRAEARKLTEEAETLSVSTSDTNDTVAQVERAVGEIADGATSQAQETQKATENVILIGNMVEETSRQVADLNTNTGAMKQASEAATDTLKQLGETNAKTKEAIEKIYEQTNTTNESAMKIREATTMITSIAEETNLLLSPAPQP